MASSKRVTVDMTTGVGTLSFPHVFPSTASTNDKGETIYDIQIIIPKSNRSDVRTLLTAIKKVGEAQWGDKWKQVKTPLRDGDAEKDQLTEDGSTKGEKYPERLGAYFMNARARRPVAVVDRTRTPITEPDEIYGGCKGKIAVTFYPYSTAGNHGVGVGLNGVQKIADGDSFGGGRPAVESMFDLLDDDDFEDDDFEDDDFEDDDFEDDDFEDDEAPAKKAPAKKAPVEDDDFEDDDFEDDDFEDDDF